jgi:hypothetical protein
MKMPAHPLYTARTERVLVFAREEAVRFGQNYVSTEHLLLGLLREDDTVAARLLTGLGVASDALRAEVEQRITPAWRLFFPSFDLTPRACRVLELAQDEACRVRNRYVGTEHLLIGLIRERDGLAGRILAKFGLTPRRAREALEAFQGAPDPAYRPPAEFDAPPLQEAPAIDIGTETVSSLLDVLQQEGSRHRPSMHEGWLLAYLFVAGPLILASLCCALTDRNWRGLFGAAILLLGGGMALNGMVGSRRQKEAAQKLACHDDPSTVAWLVSFLAWSDRDVQAASIRALTRLLPRLRASDAYLLEGEWRQRLYETLNSDYVRREPDFVIAVLKALEQIGDAAALPYVHHLAQGSPRTANRKRVQAAAWDCLPFLQTRIEQQHSRQTLLRAASPDVAPETLLRPAAAAPVADPDELLRPGPSRSERTPDSGPALPAAARTPRVSPAGANDEKTLT